MNTFRIIFRFLKTLVCIALISGIDTLNAQEALTLERALKIGESTSPTIQISLLNLERYQKSLEAQRASLKSQFSLTVNPVNYSNSRQFDDRTQQWYTSESFSSNSTLRVSQPILWTDGTISLVNRFGWQNTNSDFGGIGGTNKAFTNNLYLSLEQPVFTYNRQKMDLQQLELNFENARISYAMQRLNLEKNITQFFYNVYMSQLNLEIAREELNNTQNSYDIIKNKVDAGLAAQEELYQAELNLATSESSLQNSQVSYENAKDQLKLYLGMDLYNDIVILADIDIDTVQVDLENAIDQGLASRMEIRQREIDIENSQFSLIQTKALNEFSGNVSLSVGITGENEAIGQIYETPTRNPQVSLSFNIPIFDWGERRARIEAQTANIQSAEINLSEEKQQIIIGIRQVYRNLQNQLNQIEIARQSEINAELTYEINLQRYENGDLTGMDLNLYQTQLSEKKIASAQALINYKLELLNMKIQSLYDFENDIEIIPSELYSINN
ncbi:MAG: TolC family protein [Bacteroidales bacterium]|nr:TolC family protein [Bacteroidales bacterium]